MWADLINKDKVHRVLWCALYMAVTLLLQNTVFAHIALFGVHAMFVPAVVVAVGVFEGGTWGAVFGLIAGYFGAMGYPGTEDARTVGQAFQKYPLAFALATADMEASYFLENEENP